MKESDFVALSHRTGFAIRHISEIVCLQSFGNYTWVHLDSGEKYLVCKLLSQVLLLLDDRRFVRTHRSYAVNTDLLANQVSLSENEDYLTYKDLKIQVSKRYRGVVRHLLAS